MDKNYEMEQDGMSKDLIERVRAKNLALCGVYDFACDKDGIISSG